MTDRIPTQEEALREVAWVLALARQEALAEGRLTPKPLPEEDDE